MMILVVTALGSYLLGSIPFGLLLTRAAGLGDIRQIGSGVIGATNVLRTGRKGLALATLLLDSAKGAAAVLVARWLGGPDAALVAALFSVLGHIFPVWLGFRGGKGVATGAGVLLALAWPVGVAACLAWLAMAIVTRFSSAASLVACVVAPIIAAFMPTHLTWLVVLGMSLVIIARHRANIARLIAGTEPRIGQAKASAA